jgi:hypothetical protein
MLGKYLPKHSFCKRAFSWKVNPRLEKKFPFKFGNTESFHYPIQDNEVKKEGLKTFEFLVNK